MSNKPHLRPRRKKQQASPTIRLLVAILILAIFALAIALAATGRVVPHGRFILLRGGRVGLEPCCPPRNPVPRQGRQPADGPGRSRPADGNRRNNWHICAPAAKRACPEPAARNRRSVRVYGGSGCSVVVRVMRLVNAGCRVVSSRCVGRCGPGWGRAACCRSCRLACPV